MPTVIHPDPFAATLLSSPTLPVTLEQKNLIMEILDTACSDSFFAKKAYAAIEHVLIAGITKAPTLTSLTPNSAELGDPSFTLHVHGTNFAAGSVIVFAGVDEPTTVVGPTEVTTGVNMDLWVGPDAIPVFVRNANGVQSDPLNFTFTDGIQSLSAHKSEPAKSPVQKHVDSPVTKTVEVSKSFEKK